MPPISHPITPASIGAQPSFLRLDTPVDTEDGDTDLSPNEFARTRVDPIQLLSEKERVYQDRLSQMELQFAKAVGAQLKIPIGYEKVSVLIIRWHEDMLDFPVDEEINGLTEILQLFNFHIEQKVLQHGANRELGRALYNFICDHDSPNSLSLVYYNGHGEYHEDDKDLYLHPKEERGKEFAQWKKAERHIFEDGQGDFLAILDACYAANVNLKGTRSADSRYQFLSAAGFDRATPTKDSFTVALTKALREFHEAGEPFDTWQLRSKLILQNRSRRYTPDLFDRLSNDGTRFIRLDRQRRDEDLAAGKKSKPVNSIITLDFKLDLEDVSNLLSDEQIQEFARRISKACVESKVGIGNIEWSSFRPMMSIEGAFSTVNAANKVGKRLRRFSSRKRRPSDSLASPLAKRQAMTPGEGLLSPWSNAVSDEGAMS